MPDMRDAFTDKYRLHFLSNSYVDYPDPIRIDSESSQNYGCNC
jgi:hypothetical protein